MALNTCMDDLLPVHALTVYSAEKEEKDLL